MTTHTGNLLHNLILFGRLLRALGMDVNPGRMVDLVRALDHVSIGHKADFYFTARSLLVHEHDDLPLFDQAFDLFWRKPAGEGVWLDLNSFRPEEPSPTLLAPPQPENMAQESEQEGSEEEGDEETQEIIEITRTYSQRELLRQKDFATLTKEELTAVRWLMAQMVWDLGLRQTRRMRAGYGRQPDLRRLMRKNLRYGGELLEWPSREPKFKPRPLIIIADISGSMEQYTRLLLHFSYGLAESLTQKVESFVFSTRLTRITRELHGRDLDRAISEVASQVHDWAGGTRIGESLKTFNYDWGRRVLGRGAIVLLISDGWDRGDPELLRNEIARLHRTCHRLIWLNPLLGSAQYEPLTRGMQAALPHIDDFLPVHNLASLEELALHLQNVTAVQRPSRQRQPIALKGAAFINHR
ncbi:MAG: VWA domain-containing protein [Anaerolineae bacterium]|nr:VWA domain-containing protein [Anaerolineae bacterium]